MGSDAMSVFGFPSVVKELLLLPAMIQDANEPNLAWNCDDKIKDYGGICDDSCAKTFIVAIMFFTILFVKPVAFEHHDNDSDDGNESENGNDRVEIENHLADIEIVWPEEYYKRDQGKHNAEGKFNPGPHNFEFVYIHEGIGHGSKGL